MTHNYSRSERITFWSSRILACAILALWGLFIAAHLIGDAGASSRELVLGDYVGIVSMVVSLAGLVIAFKWEVFGGVMSLVAVAVGAMVNPQTILSPVMLIPAAAMLFLAHAWSTKTESPSDNKR